MTIKTFKYKGQMINYYNKVRKNPKIDLCYCGFFTKQNAWVVEYCYK